MARVEGLRAPPRQHVGLRGPASCQRAGHVPRRIAGAELRHAVGSSQAQATRWSSRRRSALHPAAHGRELSAPWVQKRVTALAGTASPARAPRRVRRRGPRCRSRRGRTTQARWGRSSQMISTSQRRTFRARNPGVRVLLACVGEDRVDVGGQSPAVRASSPRRSIIPRSARPTQTTRQAPARGTDRGPVTRAGRGARAGLGRRETEAVVGGHRHHLARRRHDAAHSPAIPASCHLVAQGRRRG